MTPTLSDRILEECGVIEQLINWSKGIYTAPTIYRMGIVVIHQLPVNNDTLWLRILGRGRVQEDAITELKNLPDSYPQKKHILNLVYGLLTVLEIKRKQGQNLQTEDKELIMKLSTIFLERLEQATNEGREEGLHQEATLLVMRQLRRKLGEIPPEIETRITNLSTANLESLAEGLLDFKSLEDLLNWLNLQSI